MQEFFDNTDKLFPLINKLPHILPITHPLWDVERAFRGLLSHPNFKRFIVLAGEPVNINTTIDFSNTIATMYTNGLHLHAGHHKLVEPFSRDIAK